MSATALLGCGAAQPADTTDAGQPETLIEIDPAVNVCPVFDRSLIIPLDIAPTVAAQIAVKASDPDGNDATLLYAWNASSGSFSDPNRPTTSYHCSALGPQVLSVTAQDVHGCRGRLALYVSCIAE